MSSLVAAAFAVALVSAEGAADVAPKNLPVKSPIGPTQWSIVTRTSNGAEIVGKAPLSVTPDGVRVPGRSKPLPWLDVRSVRYVPPRVKNAAFGEVFLEAGAQGDVPSEAKRKFRRGPHRFHLGYLAPEGLTPELSLEIKGPPFPQWQPVSQAMFVQPDPPGGGYPKEWRSPGLDDDGFRVPEQLPKVRRGLSVRRHGVPEGFELAHFEDVRSLPLDGYGGNKTVAPPIKNGFEPPYAAVIQGHIKIPRDGEYSFRLKSSGSARMYLGDWPQALPAMTVQPDPNAWDLSLVRGGRAVGTLTSWENGELMISYPNDIGSDRADFTIPVKSGAVREMWRVHADAGAGVARVTAAPGEDVVYAAGRGDTVQGVSGQIVGLKEDKLRFEFRGKERTISMEKVIGIVPGPDESLDASPADEYLRFDVVGPTLLPGRLLPDSEWNGKCLIELPWGGVAETRFQLLRRIDVVGGRVINLPDLKPAEVTRTPLLDLEPVVLTDTTPAGKRPKIGRRRVRPALCMTPLTRVTYDLGGRFGRLHGGVGMQAGEGDHGHADVRVLGDAAVLFEHTGLVSKDGRVPVDVDLAGVDKLTLEVDFGDNFDIGDVVIWAEPELVRKTGRGQTALNDTKP